MRTTYCPRFPGRKEARCAWLETPNELGAASNNLTDATYVKV